MKKISIYAICSFVALSICVTTCVSCNKEPDNGPSKQDIKFTKLYSEPQENEEDYHEYKPFVFHINDTKSFNYRLLEPGKELNPYEKVPLVLYLHSLFSPRDGNNKNQLDNIKNLFLEIRKDYPAYFVCPVCPDDAYWSYLSRPERKKPYRMPITEESYMGYALIKLVEDISNHYPIDTSRIYIMGCSMGAIGTLDMIVRHPHTFAAAMSFAGSINTEKIDKEAVDNVPLWLFHGQADTSVPVEGSRETYNKYIALGATDCKYSEYELLGHSDMWKHVFSCNEIYDAFNWMFSHRKSNISFEATEKK